MYEDRPEKDTPDWVRQELIDYSGLSPNGLPLWRMVLAQNCRIHCFGWQNRIAKGRAEAIGEDPGAKATFQPDGIEEGEFWIPRYRLEGWILEKWFPASTWGTKEHWEAQKARDGRHRLLASYPQYGAYFMLAGPWTSISAAGDLKGAIRCYNLQQRKNPVNWENHLQVMARWEEDDRQQAADRYAEEMAAQHREGFSSLLRSASGAAQSVRNIIAEQTVGGVNLGASEKWG